MKLFWLFYAKMEIILVLYDRNENFMQISQYQKSK